MRSNCSVKTFSYLLTILLLIIILITLSDLKYSNECLIINKVTEIEESLDVIKDELEIRSGKSRQRIKYILQWTSPKTIPFEYMGEGQKTFIERNCTFTNCYVTADRGYLSDVTKFDVIAFHGPELVRKSVTRMPDRRSYRQKYVFASIESSDNYPFCSNRFNNFFNWTWTYKVDSDARWGYMVVRDSKNNIIGPRVQMHWMKLADMDPVPEDLKERLKTKKKAAAWFVSNCRSKSHREEFVAELQKRLNKYNLSVDIYGRCGTLSCPPEKQDECIKMIERDYYFYLSFENSFSDDYVTEKLLYPLQNNAIPIVFGAANYSRFMPDGIYLNARELGTTKLAEIMHELISNPDKYAEYFRWKKHYSYHYRSESAETDDYCGFCAMLNNESLLRKISTYPIFREWWNPVNAC